MSYPGLLIILLFVSLINSSQLQHKLKSSLKAFSQYQYLGIMSQKNCKWLDFMYEQTQNVTLIPEYLRDTYQATGEECSASVCKSKETVLNEAVCKAFVLYPNPAKHEGLYYAQTIRIYNQTESNDEYNTGYLAQYLFMVLPSELKFFHKKYKPKLISVVVPVKIGEQSFSMRNCPLDYSDSDTQKAFKENDTKQPCLRKVDFDHISIRHVGPEERNRTWTHKQQNEEEEDEMDSQIFQ